MHSAFLLYTSGNHRSIPHPDVGECLYQFCRFGGHRKCGIYTSWYFVTIYYRSRETALFHIYFYLMAARPISSIYDSHRHSTLLPSMPIMPLCPSTTKMRVWSGRCICKDSHVSHYLPIYGHRLNFRFM